MAEGMGSYSLSDIASVLGNGKGMDGYGYGAGSWFIWIILLFFLFNRNGWGENNGVRVQGATADSVQDVLRGQSEQTILSAVSGNTDAIRELASSMNVSFGQMKDCCCATQKTILESSAATGMSIKELEKSVLLGDQNVLSTLNQCCCSIKTELLNSVNGLNTTILTGFANTNQNISAGVNSIDKTLCQANFNLQSAANNLQNTMQAGFSAVGYAAQANTNQLIQAGNDNTNRILSYLQETKATEQAVRIADLKNTITTQESQAAIIAAINAKSCGCGCSNSCNGCC